MLGQFLPEQIVLEGSKVLNYRVLVCPNCGKSQLIEEEQIFNTKHSIITIRCPWCKEKMLHDVTCHPELAQRYVVRLPNE